VIPFEKWHGLGNDFVILDGTVVPASPDSAAIQALCERRFGVGSDGVLLVTPLEQDSIRMEMWNPDGSRSGMCGNGLRCATLFARQRDWIRSRGIVRLDERTVAVHTDGDKVTVEMGSAIVGPWIDAPTPEGPATEVSIGNPHVVFFGPAPAQDQLIKLGHQYQTHEHFPEGVNVHFTEVIGPGEVRQTTFERGAGITLACGSGACAVVAAGVATGRLERQTAVHLPGGILQVEIKEAGPVLMTGLAEFVFVGTWPLA
jgi:diaminopimelate epimerase